jgi:hypothetical protein
LSIFKPTDLLVLNGEGVFYNTNLSVPRYRAFTTFKFDHVEVSDDATGNYEDYTDVILKSKQSVNDKMFLITVNKGFNAGSRITSI